jgi:hypothetical protein
VLLLLRMFVWCTNSSPSSVFQCEYTFPKRALIFRFRDQTFEPTSAVNPVYVNRGDVIRSLVKNNFVSFAEFDGLVLKMFGAQHCRVGPVVQVRLAPFVGRLLDPRQINGDSCYLLVSCRLFFSRILCAGGFVVATIVIGTNNNS